MLWGSRDNNQAIGTHRYDRHNTYRCPGFERRCLSWIGHGLRQYRWRARHRHCSRNIASLGSSAPRMAAATIFHLVLPPLFPAAQGGVRRGLRRARASCSARCSLTSGPVPDAGRLPGRPDRRGAGAGGRPGAPRHRRDAGEPGAELSGAAPGGRADGPGQQRLPPGRLRHPGASRGAGNRMARAFSVHTVGGTLGWAVAPVLVAGIAALASWRIALLVSGCIGLALAALVLANRSLPRDARATASPAHLSAGAALAGHLRLFTSAPDPALLPVLRPAGDLVHRAAGLHAAVAAPAVRARHGGGHRDGDRLHDRQRRAAPWPAASWPTAAAGISGSSSAAWRWRP